MAVLVLGQSTLAVRALVGLLGERGIVAAAGRLEGLPARGDDVLVLLALARWDGAAATELRQATAGRRDVFVVCGAPVTPSGRAAMVAAGAADVFADDVSSLRELAAKARRWVDRPRRLPVRLGELRFDPGRSSLAYRGRAVDLTRTEVWLLWRLCEERAVRAGSPLASCRLAAEQVTEEAAIRNHVAHLRRQIERVLGHPRVLFLKRGRGYWLQPPDDHSTARPA